MSTKAVILFSGGLDSTTCLASARSNGIDCLALSFNYAQRHSVELDAAKKIAKHYGVRHEVFNIGINQFGGSALTDGNIAVPENNQEQGIPSTYVPARNTIFLSIALGWAEVFNANEIILGISSVDYSGYPDCRPEYLNAFQALANLATKSGVEGSEIKLNAPLLYLTKAETVKLGAKLGVDYSMTVSCYQANAAGHACGKCDSCRLRRKGFDDAGLADPTHYFK